MDNKNMFLFRIEFLDITMYYDDELNDWYLGILNLNNRDLVVSQYLQVNNLSDAKIKALNLIEEQVDKMIGSLYEEINKHRNFIQLCEEIINNKEKRLIECKEVLNDLK